MNSLREHAFAVILAGGIGTRFWPKSREAKPKQYLSLINQDTLIQNTAQRLQEYVQPERLYIVSTQAQKPLIHQQLPHLSPSQLIMEPCGRNTAPAAGLAAAHLTAVDDEAIMIVAPADHHIDNVPFFWEALDQALTIIAVDASALVTFGIPPTYPSTGYGYIKVISKDLPNATMRVHRFIEKPDRTTAETFLQKNDYFWNSGIFVWKAATFLERICSFMPDLHSALCQIQSVLQTDQLDPVTRQLYDQMRSQSIDYGIMEKAENVHMVKAKFGWSDVGSWREVYELGTKDKNHNVILGNPLLKEVKNSYIAAESRTISIIGVDNLIVIEQEDALLICHMDHAQDVRWVTSELAQKKINT
ncbi:MAG: mannose-1-phosphate guanylyltransferase [Calditrichaeota bacterium]|nr:MAG: mannose-1-phosphate guanylyltransferase [Calditrichota bacterium]